MPICGLFRPVSFEDLPGWDKDRLQDAFCAFRRCALEVLATRPYRTGALGVEAQAFRPAFAEAARLGPLSRGQADTFFRRHFSPYRIERDEHGLPAKGFVTGFYEPEHAASRAQAPGFHVPLLARPDDLVAVDAADPPPGWDPAFAFGRMSDDGLVEYHDRAAIEKGALGPRARPLAWLADRVDAFFIHVQGAARLRLPDGGVMRLSYAAKSGHPFTGPGRVLAGLGEIAAGAVTMQTIRAWLAAHPQRVDEILHRNRSYIFFRETPLGDAALGPFAAARVQLTPGRSIAVDRLLHSFATPFFIDAPDLDAFGAGPFRRLMVAQDTGSAIVGAARGDLFAGCGPAAGEIAGTVRHGAQFYVLLPRAGAGDAP